jgi:membrane protein DedA with SNARE-associated domain
VALPMIGNSELIITLGIVLSAFVSEDASTFAAAALAGSKTLDVSSALLSAFLGLWVSDFAVYAAARVAREKLPAQSRTARWLSKSLTTSADFIPASQGQLALGISRFLPGTRFPAYVGAGLFRMPVLVFAGITAVSAALWTLVVFLAVHFFPVKIDGAGQALTLAGFVGLAVFVLVAAWRTWGAMVRRQVAISFQKWRRWEFWPPWVFYPPVALMCGWLAIRFRGLSLPTVANPAQRNGGMIGESKIEILRELMRTAPAFTADAYLIAPGPLVERMQRVESLAAERKMGFPFVLKPDAAQRGSGFRKVQSWQDTAGYLDRVKSPVVLQRYIGQPKEAGIFYYRFPSEERGHIFSITRKVFPCVVGNGRETLEHLIRQDKRASLIASTYLARFGESSAQVVPEGQQVRLVEAGNHCQGCIFQEGADLNTDLLCEALDRITGRLTEFFVGRFDVRYENDDELRDGVGFTIIELNGAASEATNIYDEDNSLWTAYKTLYRQWKLVYQIGAENRGRGFRPVSPLRVWKDLREFRRIAECYPRAD